MNGFSCRMNGVWLKAPAKYKKTTPFRGWSSGGFDAAKHLDPYGGPEEPIQSYTSGYRLVLQCSKILLHPSHE
jgi:hypothetical protein